MISKRIRFFFIISNLVLVGINPLKFNSIIYITTKHDSKEHYINVQLNYG